MKTVMDLKKVFSCTLVILILSLSLNDSGCSVKIKENDSHLRFYCLKDGTTTHIGGYDPLKDFIRKYNGECDQNGLTEDKIELVEFDSEKQLSEKMSTEIMAGKGPDILTSRFSLPFEKLKGSGALYDIYELSESSDIGLKNCNSEILKYGTINGKLYMIPLYYSPDVFVTTEETLAKYGLTSKSFSFIDLSKALKNNHITYSLLGSEDSNISLLYSFLSSYIDFESGATAFDTDEFSENLDYMVELISNDKTDENIYYFLYENIKNGKSILYKEFPSVYQVFRTYCFLSYLGSTPVLVYNYNRYNHTCSASVDVSVGINNNSQHKDKAQKFIKYCLSDENQMHISEEYGYLPVNNNALTALIEQTNEEIDFNDDGTISESEKAVFHKARITAIKDYSKAINSIDRCTYYSFDNLSESYYNSSVIGDIVHKYLNGEISKEKFIRQLTSATEIYLTE